MNRLLTLALTAALLAPVSPLQAEEYQDARAQIEKRMNDIERDARRRGKASQALDALIAVTYERTMLESPEFATYVGLDQGQDRWTDESMEAIERRAADRRRDLEILRLINRDALDDAAQLNYDLALYDVEREVQGQRFPTDLLAITQLGGIQQFPAQLLAMMPTATPADYDNIVGRLENLAPSIRQAQSLLKAGLAAGVTPPRVTLRDIPRQIEALLTDDPMDSALFAPFAKIPESFDADRRAGIVARAGAAWRDHVAPAYRELHAFLVNEYLPGARESIAATDLPDGEAWYAHRVRQMTTTDLSPREIHEIGLAEVRRIRAEMDKTIAAAGFEGDFAAFTEFLRTDPQFYFDSAEELVVAYRDICKRADAALVKVIGKLPRLPYGVEPVPDFIAPTQTTAYYQPGSAEAGRAGVFYANTYALETRPKWEMEALSLHEAVPGHHLQLALQAEVEDMPWFRRWGGQTAFVEGWGLYSESLGVEMGFYQDPYARFGQLTYEMWRAIRLVVDTGMHALGWSREQALQFFKDNASKTEHDIVVEVDRYIAWPAQALAYKIGELKIKELRARASAELGADFDLRAFHDAVLGAGSLPLSVLETRIDAWIASHRASLTSAAR